MPNEDLAYATDNGFYIGDRVEVPDGRKGDIDEIILKGVNWQLDHETYVTVTIVRLDQELWPDIQLTRIA